VNTPSRQGFERLDRAQREAALHRRRDDRRGKRMLASARDWRRARGLRRGRGQAPFGRRSSAAFLGERTGLVDDQRVDPCEALEAPRRSRTHASTRTRPVATITDIGVARPSAHGQAMMSTATAFTSAYASRGSGPATPQAIAVSAATPSTTGTKTAETASASCWIGARLPSLGDESDDLRQHRIRPDPLGLHDEAAAPLSVPPDTTARRASRRAWARR
jgi:hypothetical protein